MTNAIAFREVMLRRWVNAADFEKFVTEEFNACDQSTGVKNFILTGVRGDRAGGYLHVARWDGADIPSGRLCERGAERPADELQEWIQFGLGPATAGRLTCLVQTGLWTSYATVGKEMAEMPEEILIEPVMLRPRVSEADFERFVTVQYYAMSRLPGEEGYLLKGNRGDRAGKYLLLIAYESVAVRNRRSSAGGELSADMQQWLDSVAVKTAVAKWDSLAQTGLYTSYIVLDK